MTISSVISDVISVRSFLIAVGISSICLVGLAIFRLYFSPIASIPGPRLAGLTHLYGMYYDIICGGQYVWQIEKMHKLYGPIVRIKPDTVHINSYQQLDKVYGTGSKRRNKSQLHCNSVMVPGAFVATPDHELHRTLRAPWSPYFSHQNIRRLEPILQRCMTKMLANLSLHAEKGMAVSVNTLMSAATNDIVMEYSFGECLNNLDVEDLNKDFLEMLEIGSSLWHLATYFSWLPTLLDQIPETIALKLNPGVAVMKKFDQTMAQIIDGIRTNKDDIGKKTIYAGLVDSTQLPDWAKSTKSLVTEGRVIMAAGTHTTAATMSKLIYHLLSDSVRLKKLQAELEIAIPDVDSMIMVSKVDNLPYLNACIQEILRLHPGGSMRQERVSMTEDLIFPGKNGKQHKVPAGTTMSMTAPLLTRDETLYPDAESFVPERFLENPHLKQHSLTFSRGTRICLGMNLAYMEMQIFISGIFRKYSLYDGTGKQTCPTLELFETGKEDVYMAADFGLPWVRKGSEGIKVMVRQGAS